MAVHRRGGQVPGVIHDSDRGGEYSSHALERELRRHGAVASMGSVADCFDCEHGPVAVAGVWPLLRPALRVPSR